MKAIFYASVCAGVLLETPNYPFTIITTLPLLCVHKLSYMLSDNLTSIFRGDLEPTKVLESGVEHPTGHFHLGLCSAVFLWARFRVRLRGEQMTLAGIPSISE